jgi:PAS domain S-box-containing protein
MSEGRMPAAELARIGNAILNAASDAIVYADREGAIRFWNAGAERIFGIPVAEALGRSLDIIIPGPQRARHWDGFQKVMETGHSRYGQGDVLAVPGLRGDGTRISLEFTIVPIQAEDGRMEGMIAILRDVTRRFEEVRGLRRTIADLQEQLAAARPASGDAAIV